MRWQAPHQPKPPLSASAPTIIQKPTSSTQSADSGHLRGRDQTTGSTLSGQRGKCLISCRNSKHSEWQMLAQPGGIDNTATYRPPEESCQGRRKGAPVAFSAMRRGMVRQPFAVGARKRPAALSPRLHGLFLALRLRPAGCLFLSLRPVRSSREQAASLFHDASTLCAHCALCYSAIR